MVYPWKDELSSWAGNSGLHVDALGLVTILGSDEINASVGRLVTSPFLEFLPLLGAFVIAGNRFTEKQAGFNMYDVSKGIQTTELAGWLTRWLKAQDFHQIHHRVEWKVDEKRRRWDQFLFTFAFIGLPLNGMLLAMTVLSGDWWGFANAMAMVVSVIVRSVLVWQNRAGIDRTIKRLRDEKAKQNAKESKATKGQIEPPATDEALGPNATVIVVMNDSKVITMVVPECLIAPVFAVNPEIPNPFVYKIFRWIGWTAFAVHIISIGMAILPTQIFTVVLLIASTILTCSKFSCEDSTIWRNVKGFLKAMKNNKASHAGSDSSEEISCWISSSLKAVTSKYPLNYEPPDYRFPHEDEPSKTTKNDEEANELYSVIPKKPRTKRRQDLYVWLKLGPDEEKSMKVWSLFPHEIDTNKSWYQEYEQKKVKFREAIRGSRAVVESREKQITRTTEHEGNEITSGGDGAAK